MSIIGEAATGAAATGGANALALGMLAILALVAVIVAWRAGVFRRGGIVGPPRVAEGEPLAPLLLILGGGFVLWIMLQVACLAPARPGPPAPAPSTVAATRQATSQPSISVSPARMALAASVPGILAGAFMVAANAVARPGGLRGLGLSPAQFRAGVKAGLVGAAVMVPLVFVAAQATQMVWDAIHYSHPSEHDLLRLMGESHSPLVAAVLIASAVLVAPVFEEILFRGHLQTLITFGLARLRHRRGRAARGFDVVMPGGLGAGPFGPPPPPFAPEGPPGAGVRWVSVLVTSLLFSAVHPSWTIPPIFVLSVCLGYAYERTGNLWTTITMHAVFNTVSTVIYLVFMR